MEYEGMIVGLGNPGKRYDGTRHNCGFMLADKLLELAQDTGEAEELNGKKFNSRLWRLRLPQLPGNWLLAKPQTFMNDSGAAVRPLLSWHNLKAAQMVVAQDELDIPPGELRFKFGGGLAGHNGLRSIVQHIGTEDFYRLRIGIGKPIQKSDMLDWVLGRPAPRDAEKIKNILPKAVETLFVFAADGAHEAEVYARHANANL